MEKQLSPAFNFGKVYVAIEDQYLYPILKKLICYDGKYYVANKILQLRKKVKDCELTEELKQIEQWISLCRDISIALWDKQDIDQAERILNELEHDTFCIDVELCKMYVLYHKAESISDYVYLQQQLLNILKRCQEQGEVLKLLGDVEMWFGNKNIAAQYYNRAEEVLDNGLVLLDMKKRGHSVA